MTALQFTKADFEEKVLKSTKPVMVDFWAKWCAPCRMAGPIIDEIALAYQGKAVVGKVNVEEEPELASQYNIMSIPAVVIFKNGKEVERQVGLLTKEGYEEMIKKHL